MIRTWSSLLQGECLEQPATDDAVPRCGNPASLSDRFRVQKTAFTRTLLLIYEPAAGICTHHNKTGRFSMNFRGAEEPTAACQPMLDEQYWAGGHFYQFVKFFRGCRIKNDLCASLTSCGQTCFFEGLGTICVWFVCQMQA